MASEIRVNTINNRSGLGTISITNSGAVFSGVTTFAQIKTTSGEVTVGTGASVYSPATNVLALGTNNAERVRITSSGNVGIGTDNPQQELDVNGSIRAVDGTAPKIIVSDNFTSQRFIFGYDQSRAGHNLGSKILADGLNIGYYTRLTQNGSHIFYTNNSGSDAERLRITSSGNVGIGTDNPGRLLQVYNASSNPQVNIKSATGGTCELQFGDNADEVRGNIVYNCTDDYLSLHGYNNDERLRITSSGNVGIGTDNPDEKFEVYGGKIKVDGGGNRWITIDPGSNTTYEPRIEGSHELVFRSYVASGSGVKTCTFTSNGDLDLTQGRNLKFASGQGIDFSATANSSGSTSSEVLDDYEEGTWTPDLRFAGSNTGISYAWRNGHYTKIGRQVTVRGAFGLSSRGTFNATDDAFIYGLPFDVAPYGVTGGFHYMFGSAYNGYQGLFQLELQHSSSFSDHVPVSRQTAWGGAVSPMEYQDIGGSQRMAFIFSYFTAS